MKGWKIFCTDRRDTALDERLRRPGGPSPGTPRYRSSRGHLCPAGRTDGQVLRIVVSVAQCVVRNENNGRVPRAHKEREGGRERKEIFACTAAGTKESRDFLDDYYYTLWRDRRNFESAYSLLLPSPPSTQHSRVRNAADTHIHTSVENSTRRCRS